MRLDAEAEITQDLRPQPVAQADVFEPDHVPLRRTARGAPSIRPPIPSLYSSAAKVESGSRSQSSGLFSAGPQRREPRRPAAAADAPEMAHGFRSFNEQPASVPASPLGRESPMLITCTNCGTSYQVSSASLGPTGRQVRCARCQNMWFAANTEAMADVAEAHRADLAWIAETPPGAGPPSEAATEAGTEGFSWPAEPPNGGADSAADPAQAQAQDPSQADAQDRPQDPSWPSGDALPPPVVSDAPPLAPTEPTPSVSLPPPEDIESVAARRANRQAAKRRRWQRSVATAAILTLLTINLALLGWRDQVVRLLPQTASLFAAIGLPVNLRGLVFAEVSTKRETHDGTTLLMVEGTIVNDTRRVAEVPRLRFAIRNQMGHELYSWTALPDRNGLRPGESLPFSTRLASPPPDTERVEVRFFSRRDLVAETP
jgi:predicted Zn finger-like uncharacterized protein